MRSADSRWPRRRSVNVIRPLEASRRACSSDSAQITHAWGGPLGIPRDWQSSVGFDRDSGLAWAGGYVGDGVSTTNLAGRTLADLITGADTDLTHLPWVNHRSKLWEPEPLRRQLRCRRRVIWLSAS